jgi:hypothetical protein
MGLLRYFLWVFLPFEAGPTIVEENAQTPGNSEISQHSKDRKG